MVLNLVLSLVSPPPDHIPVAGQTHYKEPKMTVTGSSYSQRLDSVSFSVAVPNDNTHFDSHKHNEYNLFV